MKHLLLLFGLIIAFGTTLTFNVYGQDDGKMSEEDMMAAYMEMIAPDENHKWLAQMAGSWNYEMAHRMAPEAPWEKVLGTADYTIEMGGRYLVQKVHAEMMGIPFEGAGTTAYDKVAGQYISTWYDSFGTGIMIFKGQREGNTYISSGEYMDPMTMTTQIHRMVVSVESDNKHKMEYFVTPKGGEEFQSLTIKYTRN